MSNQIDSFDSHALAKKLEKYVIPVVGGVILDFDIAVEVIAEHFTDWYRKEIEGAPTVYANKDIGKETPEWWIVDNAKNAGLETHKAKLVCIEEIKK